MLNAQPRQYEKKFERYIVVGGGTIDSHWDPSRDTAVPNIQSVIQEALERGPRLSNIRSQTIVLKDSRDIGKEDRRRFTNCVAEVPAHRVIATCGTYLMTDLAKSIHRHPIYQYFEKFDKRVTVTGSIIPVKGFVMSDGLFNVGMCDATLQQDDLKPRLFIVMNGSVFDVSDVEKDLSRAEFSSSDGDDILGFNKYLLIPAGGSIDFEPDGMDSWVPAQMSTIPFFLREKVRSTKEIEVTPPILKDSTLLTQGDKDLIVDMVRSSTRGHTLITSGIYRIHDLSDHLQSALTGNDKERTIVCTGSRLSLEHCTFTDATYQLGYAIGRMGFEQPGVHTAINGKVLKPGESVISHVFTEAEIEQLKQKGII
jgi:hypothetical protein